MDYNFNQTRVGVGVMLMICFDERLSGWQSAMSIQDYPLRD
ncbi:hypothetical protein ACNKHL_23390 [Shigella flexneri]